MKKKGFTLAEVLLTLVIIGVISVMIFPTVINNTKRHEFRSAIKKALSNTNRALELNYGLTNLTAKDYSSNEDIVENLFKKRMNVIDSDLTTFTAEGEECKDGSIFVTADGMIFCIIDFATSSDEANNICNSESTIPCVSGDKPNLWIDVNGIKKPNQATTSLKRLKDIYQAQIYSQKVVPYGQITQELLFEDYNKDKI